VITKDTVVVGVPPRMGLLGFKAALDVSLSPARFEAEASFNAIVAEGVDPAFALSVFRRESQYMVAIPSSTDIGFPVRVHWAYDQGPARNISSVNKFVVHDTEGTMASDEPELTRQDAKIASCHALIAPDGMLVFMVPLGITAWTPGNDAVAEQSINVEMSGFQSKGYTEEQYKSMAAFFRWCLSQGCSIPAEYAARTGRAGILGHQDVPKSELA
jgi:hypothetical protein